MVVVVALPSVAFGQEVKQLKDYINGLSTNLQGLGGGLSTIAFIVAGIMFLTATGNPSRMTIAKGSLIAAIIGIVIIVLAGSAKIFVTALFIP